MYLYDIFIVFRPVFPRYAIYTILYIYCYNMFCCTYSCTTLAKRSQHTHALTHARTHVNTQTVEKNAVKLSTVFRVHAAVSPSSLSSSFHLRKVVYGDTSVRAVYCPPQNLWPLIRISCARGFAIIYR